MSLPTLDAANDALQHQDQFVRRVSPKTELHLIQGGQPIKSISLFDRAEDFTNELSKLGAHDDRSRPVSIREMARRFAAAKFRWIHRQSSVVLLKDSSLARRPE